MGDVADFGNFMGAVIDGSSFKTQAEAIEEAKATKGADIVVGGGYDDSTGYFVEPTVIETSDPDFRLMREEIFGPVVTTYVYDEKRWSETLDLVDRTAPVRTDGRRLLGGPGRDRGRTREAALHGRQLLRQRQADRRGRRPAAVRRRTRVGHERQGGVDVEPDPLGQPAHDQGDVHAADELPLSVPRRRAGLSRDVDLVVEPGLLFEPGS